MEAYFTWYPKISGETGGVNQAWGTHEQVPADKFLYTVDRDPELVERYRDDPSGTVAWWEAEMANQILNCTDGERSTWLAFDDEERQALREHDHVALFEMGAHPFLT